MTNKIYITLLFIPIVFILFSAFGPQQEFPHQVVQQRYAARVALFQQELSECKHYAEKLSPENIRFLQNQFSQTRIAFKQCEYLIEILDPVLVKDHLNGSPLPKLERKSFGLNVIDPKGMQTLDELIFSDEVIAEKEHIIQLITEMVNVFKDYNTHQKIYDRQIFDGMRLELIRVFTMGLTGFDTPGSSNAIQETNSSLQTLYDDLQLYLPAIGGKAPVLENRIKTNMKALQIYLAGHQDFNKLDRFFILTKFINPLFSDLYDAQQILGIENIHEALPAHMVPPVDLSSRNLFSSDFLSADKYIGVPEDLNTDTLVKLGKTLFFDPILSVNNERACSGCHNPQRGFTDGQPKSIAMGMEGTVDRNSPTLLNCVYSERYFHDMRADALEDQMEHVIVSNKEFNTSVFEILQKLSQSDAYRKWFGLCFPAYANNPINKNTLSFAMSAYVSSLRSFNSPFDRMVRGEINKPDPVIKHGFNLFMGKAGCGTCHFAPVFNGTVPPLYQESESEVLGIPDNPYASPLKLDPDRGRAVARLKESAPFYEHSFKTPTVRNVSLTAPYMHNGAYKTLRDVVDFYNKGGGTGLGIAVSHQTLPADPLNLSNKEVRALIVFMESLTDTLGLTSAPASLPVFEAQAQWNKRKIGGAY